MNLEKVRTSLQALIAQGKEDGVICSTDLNALAEENNLSPSQMEEIYNRLDAMNISVLCPEPEVDDSLKLLEALLPAPGSEPTVDKIPEVLHLHMTDYIEACYDTPEADEEDTTISSFVEDFP